MKIKAVVQSCAAALLSVLDLIRMKFLKHFIKCKYTIRYYNKLSDKFDGVVFVNQSDYQKGLDSYDAMTHNWQGKARQGKARQGKARADYALLCILKFFDDG